MARNPDNWADQQLSAGRYRVTAKLGEGGMGYVYRARDANLGSDVVIKVPKLAMLVERQFQERFVRELRSLVKLSHPHIVTITDVGREGKIPYAVMQFLGGGDLSDRLSSDPARLADWLPAIAAALDYVHKQGFVHRDVKPGNILFDEEGHAFLSDFGIAKVVSDTQQEQDNLTGTGMVVGTSDYMAPELIMGKEISGSIDQYALAITVYEALAGKRPFTGTTPSAIMVAHTTEQPAPIDGLPAGLQQALLRGMAKIPADRYANCTAFAEAISASLVGASVAASSYPLAPPSPPPLISTPDSARLDCPECGKSLRATAQAAGRSVTCPGCGVKLRVAEDLSGLAVRDPAAGSPGSSKETMILDPASGTSKPGLRPAGSGSGSESPLPMDTDATQATIDTSRRVRTDPAHVKAIGALLHRAWDHIPKSINALVLVLVGLAVVVLFGLLGLALFSTDDRPEAGKATIAESEGTDLQPQQALQAQLKAERAARAAAEKKAAAQIARLEREKSTADKAVAKAERARLEREQAARAKAAHEAARRKTGNQAAREKAAKKQARPNFTAHTITTAAKGALSVFAADVDSDGDTDLLSASAGDNKIAWYENDGRQNFTTHTISRDAKGARSVFAGDLDGDGDTDLLSASYRDNKIAWYENDGRQRFTAHTISRDAKGARSVFAADVDGDGDTDVLSASWSDNKIAWYENDGRQNFRAHTISTEAKGARSVFAGDLDGDGDTDVLSASAGDNKIAWYENDGRQRFTTRTITTDGSALSVFAADLDSDGDTDVLSASYNDDKIAWYENDGRQNFTTRTISRDARYARLTALIQPYLQESVFAADLDSDGDTDVFIASAGEIPARIAWYENDGRQNFTTRTITTDAKGVGNVFAADVDGDGDIDVLSASFNDDKIAWYENSLIAAEAQRKPKIPFREKKVTAAYQARHENPAAYLRSLGLDLQDNQWHMKSMGLLKGAVRDLKIATAKYNNYLPQYKLATREVKKNESTLRKFMAEYRLQAKDIQDYLINNWPTINQDEDIRARFSTWKTWARTGRNKKGERLTTFLDSKMDDFVKRKKVLAGQLTSLQQLQQQIAKPYERVSSLLAKVQADTQEIDTQQPEVDAAIKSTGASYRLPNTQSAQKEMRIAEACMEMDITSPPSQTENASSKTGEPTPRESLLHAFDKNGDGKLGTEERNDARKARILGKYNTNGDGTLDSNERNAARRGQR